MYLWFYKQHNGWNFLHCDDNVDYGITLSLSVNLKREGGKPITEMPLFLFEKYLKNNSTKRTICIIFFYSEKSIILTAGKKSMKYYLKNYKHIKFY